MIIVSIGVEKEGPGYSAFCFESDGTKHRLSPTWLRDVKVDVVKPVQVPMKEKGRFTTVERPVPTKIGEKVHVGETLVAAVERAKKALEALAVGRQPTIPPIKEAMHVA